MRAGAKLNFGKAEVYWPQDDSASDKYQTLLGIKSDTTAPDKALVAPTFDAKVTVDAALDILVTPEVCLSPYSRDHPCLLVRILTPAMPGKYGSESRW